MQLILLIIDTLYSSLGSCVSETESKAKESRETRGSWSTHGFGLVGIGLLFCISNPKEDTVKRLVSLVVKRLTFKKPKVTKKDLSLAAAENYDKRLERCGWLWFLYKILNGFSLQVVGVDIDSKHELGWGAIHAAVANISRKSVVFINLLAFCIITTPLSLLPACLMKWVLIIITFEHRRRKRGGQGGHGPSKNLRLSIGI